MRMTLAPKPSFPLLSFAVITALAGVTSSMETTQEIIATRSATRGLRQRTVDRHAYSNTGHTAAATTMSTEANDRELSVSESFCVEEEAILEQCIGLTSMLQMYDCKACIVTAYLGAGVCDDATTTSTCHELNTCYTRCAGCDTEVLAWGSCEIDAIRGTSCPAFVCGVVPVPPTLPPTNPTIPQGRFESAGSAFVLDSTLVVASNPSAPTFSPQVNNGAVSGEPEEEMGDRVDVPQPSTVPAQAPIAEATGTLIIPTLAPTAQPVADATVPITDSPTTPAPTSLAPTTTAPVVPVALTASPVMVPVPTAIDSGTGGGDLTLPPAFTTVLVSSVSCETEQNNLKLCLEEEMMVLSAQADFCLRCVLTASSTPRIADLTSSTCEESNTAACSGYTGCSTCAFPDLMCWKQMVDYGSCEVDVLRQNAMMGTECPMVNTTCPAV